MNNLTILSVTENVKLLSANQIPQSVSKMFDVWDNNSPSFFAHKGHWYFLPNFVVPQSRKLQRDWMSIGLTSENTGLLTTVTDMDDKGWTEISVGDFKIGKEN